MILTYHKVHPENKTIWWVTPDAFYLQMKDLSSKEVVYLDDYDPMNENQVVITFDGVYKDIWKYAVPILRHFNYPFELFIIGSMIGKDNSFDTVEPSAEFADFETLKKLISLGGRLQWHSWSHARLAGTKELDVFEKELSIPAELHELDSQGFSWYAYPHGERDEFYRSQVTARFKGALACDDGNDADLYDLNRITIYDDTRLSKSTVSLIIPCYNYGHFVAEAIESALLQSYPPDEILFIDDASSDNSVEVAKRYEPKIRVEVNPTNLGVIENFKKAVSLTKGDYICLLGADNRFRSDFVEKCKSVLDVYPEVGVTYTYFSLFGDRAALVASGMSATPHPKIPNLFLKEFPASPEIDINKQNYIHGSSMYRRRAYEIAGGYSAGDLPEDHSLFSRMINKGWKAKLVDDYILEYRQHSKDQINLLKSLEFENAYLRSLVYKNQTLLEQNRQLTAQIELLVQQNFEITNSKTWKTIQILGKFRSFFRRKSN